MTENIYTYTFFYFELIFCLPRDIRFRELGLLYFLLLPEEKDEDTEGMSLRPLCCRCLYSVAGRGAKEQGKTDLTQNDVFPVYVQHDYQYLFVPACWLISHAIINYAYFITIVI